MNIRRYMPRTWLGYLRARRLTDEQKREAEAIRRRRELGARILAMHIARATEGPANFTGETT